METRERVCLLTGAGGLLGSALCEMYGHHYRIAAVYRKNPPKIASQNSWQVDPLRPRRLLVSNQHRVFEIRADLTSDGEVDRVVDLALARFGRIDLLVNAAGICLDASLLERSRFEPAFEQQMLVNATLPIRVATRVWRKFWRDRKHQNIRFNRNVVNVSSTSGLVVYDRASRGAYAASKAALNFLSCHLAREFRRFGVRVNALAPTTFPKLVSTEDVANAVVRLDSAGMTGRVLVLDIRGAHLL